MGQLKFNLMSPTQDLIFNKVFYTRQKDIILFSIFWNKCPVCNQKRKAYKNEWREVRENISIKRHGHKLLLLSNMLFNGF